MSGELHVERCFALLVGNGTFYDIRLDPSIMFIT